MAGNIVKWWRHKILGGYKHFSGLHECPTDTEELIYHHRAPSSCSAPPDLVLTSDREHLSVRCQTPQQQQQYCDKETDDDKHILSTKSDKRIIGCKDETDRVHLEEFTCDVSVEGNGKTPQPLQFSFTLYDFDGHGKITKDDIAGIVSTIYDSIGKTVVVPHYGSKTINVRLTVSPDGKKTRPQKKAIITPRRRVRPRRITSDDENSDTSNDEVRQRKHHVTPSRGQKENLPKFNEKLNRISKDCSTTTTTTESTNEHLLNTKKHDESTKNLFTQNQINSVPMATVAPTPSNNVQTESNQNHIYESIHNLKVCPNANAPKTLMQCQNINHTLINHLQIKESTDGCHDCSFEVAAQKNYLRKKLLRKSRSRKHASKEVQQEQQPTSRVRSLSVGNENCYNQLEEGTDECWKSPLRRHELIEIIRESMEKNRLCFQANRKPTIDNSPSNHRHRHRSHTISKMIDEHNLILNDSTVNPHVLPETNLCGYDSFLHATICSNANNNLPSNFSTPNAIGGTPTKVGHHQHHHHHHTKKLSKSKNSHQIPTITPTTAYNRLNHMNAQAKLNTALLSQLNPNLSAEQKLSRTINHVEKWLTDRDHPISGVSDKKVSIQPTRRTKLQRSKSKEEIPIKEKMVGIVKVDNLINFEKMKIAEDLSDVTAIPMNVATSDKLKKSKNLPTQTLKSSSLIDSTTKAKNGLVLEYASIPVNAEPSECENLLRGSDEDTNNAESSMTPSTVHRYVHEHIHHHYHHFENDDA